MFPSKNVHRIWICVNICGISYEKYYKIEQQVPKFSHARCVKRWWNIVYGKRQVKVQCKEKRPESFEFQPFRFLWTDLYAILCDGGFTWRQNSCTWRFGAFPCIRWLDSRESLPAFAVRCSSSREGPSPLSSAASSPVFSFCSSQMQRCSCFFSFYSQWARRLHLKNCLRILHRENSADSRLSVGQWKCELFVAGWWTQSV